MEEIVLKVEPLKLDDSIGKGVSRMEKLKLEGLPVFSNACEYKGMVYLKDIVTTELDASAKVKNFVKKVPHLTEEKGIKHFAEYSVLPFFSEDSFLGIVLLIDYLKTVDMEVDLKKLSEETDIISLEDTLGVVRNLLSEKEVLLVAKGGKLIGAIDYFSIGRLISTKKDRVYSPDKQEEREIKVGDFVRDFVEIKQEIKKEELLETIKENGFVVYRDKIITPRTIFRNLNKVSKETKIELVGFDLEEGIYTDVVYKDLYNFAKKVDKIIKPLLIKFHLRKLKKTGKTLYEVEGRVVAGGKIMDAEVSGYGIMDLVQEVIDKLEKQVLKLKETGK